LENTVRQALFLPTSREAKYKAKQVVDSFFWRAGDMFSGLLVFAGIRLLDLGGVAAINAGLVFVWVLLAVAIAREHRKLTAQPMPLAAKASTS
jgi:ATP:ADP antiporter, AAA family